MQVDLAQTQPDTGAAGEIIRAYLQENLETLLGTMRLFVKRANLADSKGIEYQAEELLGKVITVALQKAATFDRGKRPEAWVLGIAANVTLQEQRRVFGRNRREVSVDDYANGEGTPDWWAELSAPGPEGGTLARANVKHLLSLVSDEDRQIVELSILHEMNSEEAAAILGIKPGTARVRLYRALGRLRAALEAQRKSEEKR